MDRCRFLGHEKYYHVTGKRADGWCTDYNLDGRCWMWREKAHEDE